MIADEINQFGTYLKTHRGEDTWVGSPLRVHRRCVDPMFSISNTIAYNESMVVGLGKESGERDLTEGNPAKGITPRPLLGPSAWIDMPGAESNRQHYIPAQGEMTLSILRNYMANGWVSQLKHRGLPLVYVISPFKSVAKSSGHSSDGPGHNGHQGCQGMLLNNGSRLRSVRSTPSKARSKRPLYSCLEAQTTVRSNGRRSRPTCLTWP
jgi:hypothetical protein